MKVITFQKKEVLDSVLRNGICFSENQIRFNNAPKTYEHLLNDYNDKKETNVQALFYVWVKVLKDEELSIDNEKIINRCNEMTKILDGSICMLLEVPDDLILVTSFYNYTDEMYAEESPDELESIWDSIYNLEGGNIERQGVIPYITRDMIIKWNYYN